MQSFVKIFFLLHYIWRYKADDFDQTLFKVFWNSFLSVNIYLHHCHFTQKTKDYAHDLRNWKISQNTFIYTYIVQNFFSFDIFFLPKEIQLSLWKTKQLSIGGSNFTNIN